MVKKTNLSDKQWGVLKGMASAVAIVVISFGSTFQMASSSSSATGTRQVNNKINDISLKALLGPALCLAGNIGIIAKHRFFTPEDIDGSGLTSGGTNKVKILQATLQNTLEQAALAMPVYLASSTLPESFQLLPLTSSALFVIGRFLFWAGYSHGAPARSLGFALTFYSSVGLLGVNIGTTAFQMLGY